MFCPDPNSIHSLNPARLLEMPDSPCPPLTLNFSLASRDPHLKSGSGALSRGPVWTGLQALSPPCFLPSQPFAHATGAHGSFSALSSPGSACTFHSLCPSHPVIYSQNIGLCSRIAHLLVCTLMFKCITFYLFIQHVFMEHLLRAKHCPRHWAQSIVNRRDFPGSSLIRTLYFQCMECGFEPWSGN